MAKAGHGLCPCPVVTLSLHPHTFYIGWPVSAWLGGGAKTGQWGLPCSSTPCLCWLQPQSRRETFLGLRLLAEHRAGVRGV